MRNQLLKAKTIEKRDILKGKIEAQDDFDGIIKSIPEGEERVNIIKDYFNREDSKNILISRLLDETNERIENKIISRIKYFEKLKKDFMNNPHKYV